MQIQLSPKSIGSHAFRIQVPGAAPIDAKIFITP
jgi:hypothetical protein